MKAIDLGSGPVQVSEPNRIRQIFDEIQETADNPTRGNPEICLLLLRLLLLRVDLLATHAPFAHPRAMQSLQRCKNCIDESYAILNSLADIAATCHMDAATICRLFKRFGQGTPYQYLLARKMHHAADRLQNLVKEIAAELGFADPFHFSRTFKRAHGISPQRFLELISRMPPS